MTTTVLLSRWQFGVTITYHFLFVPLTIGLAFWWRSCRSRPTGPRTRPGNG